MEAWEPFDELLGAGAIIFIALVSGALLFVLSIMGIVGTCITKKVKVAKVILGIYLFFIGLLFISQVVEVVLIRQVQGGVHDAVHSNMSSSSAHSHYPQQLQRVFNCSYNYCCNFTRASDQWRLIECTVAPTKFPRSVCEFQPRPDSTECRAGDYGLQYRQYNESLLLKHFTWIVTVLAVLSSFFLLAFVFGTVVACQKGRGTLDGKDEPEGSDEEYEHLNAALGEPYVDEGANEGAPITNYDPI